MTLFKQIALLVSLLLLLLLGTVLILNFTNTTASVQEQLYEDAKNTASSLSLSMGTAGGDESIMSTMINANFDSGHYQRIALYDMEENLVYERLIEQRQSVVPEWFLNAVKIDIPMATAQVSSGWSPIGILTVQSDSAYAYVLLYNTLISLLLLFGTLFVVGLGLLNAVLHIVLKPLDRVQKQAEAIINNEFIIQEKIPYTVEFRDVVKGMNAMVGKVKDIFEKGNRAMRHNRQLLYNDPVTKLYNRRYLMMKFPQMVGEESSYDYGSISLFALHGAQEANQVIGHQRVDELFAALGSVIQSRGEDYEEIIAARMNGTEFALLLPGCDEHEGFEIAEQVCKAAQMMMKHYELDDSETFGLNAGSYRFSRDQSIGDILSKADYALAQANLMPKGSAYNYVTHDVDSVMGKEAWREIITDAMQNDRFELAFWPVCDTRTKALHHSVMTFSLSDAEGKSYSYGKFIAPVISLGLESTVYMHVIDQLLRRPGIDECSVRLPSNFLSTPNLFSDLSVLFEHYAETRKRRITFELPDSLIVSNLDLVMQFAALFKRYGYGFGINQFTGESKNYSFLQELKPAYIKANAGFLLDQSPQSMSTLQIITDTLGIELLAESVMEEEQL
ncbi:MAG: LapD/MoxY N-terminal periplasmic domain-containing protein, partial [Sulfurimonadaceae bacterium]|nr:LapD/MoxY N-terminal periplasmic domain-containing protein [Sulfurimonadaceae bacterium]